MGKEREEKERKSLHTQEETKCKGRGETKMSGLYRKEPLRVGGGSPALRLESAG